MQAFLERLRVGDGVIDVGANVGSVTARVAAVVGASGHVLAIEPQPDVAAQCAAACARYPSVTIAQLALSDHCGTVPFHLGAQSVHGSCAAGNVPRVVSSLEVPCDTLDHVGVGVPRLAGIKIDAQGAEGAILRGATQLLQRPGLTWMVELWPAGLVACGSQMDDVIGAFAEAGWSLLAMGKSLTDPPITWDALRRRAETWRGHGHTNLLVGRV